MSLSKNGGDGEWTGKVVIWFIKGGISRSELSDLESIHDVVGENVRNKKLIRIYKWKEKCPEVELKVETTALEAGAAGIGLVVAGCAACALAPGIAPALVAKGVAYAKAAAVANGVVVGGAAVGVGGTAVAGGAILAGAAAPYVAFHEFLVFECSGDTWVTLEKNQQQITVQVCRDRDDSVTYANGKEHTRHHILSVVEIREMKPNRNRNDHMFTIENILQEAVSTKAYDCISANCLHFTQHIMEKFGRRPIETKIGPKEL